MSAAFTFRAISKSRQDESNRMRLQKINKRKELRTFSFKNTNLEKNEKDDEEVFHDALGGEMFTKYLSDTRISVDLMGKVFKVSRDTLKKMVFFRKIIDSEDAVSDIYIDRSPDTFEDILKYLTYGVTPKGKGGTGSNDTTMFLKDSYFYGVSGVT